MEKLGINTAWFLTQLINFILIILILRALAYKPILQMLETRKRKIQESLDYAEKVKSDAAAQQRQYEQQIEQVRREAQQARESAASAGEKERERILAQARDEARQIVEQARGQLDYERKQMVAELRQRTVELSMLAAQRVVGASLDEQRSRQLVNDFITTADFDGK